MLPSSDGEGDRWSLVRGRGRGLSASQRSETFRRRAPLLPPQLCTVLRSGNRVKTPETLQGGLCLSLLRQKTGKSVGPPGV